MDGSSPVNKAKRSGKPLLQTDDEVAATDLDTPNPSKWGGNDVISSVKKNIEQMVVAFLILSSILSQMEVRDCTDGPFPQKKYRGNCTDICGCYVSAW